MTETHGDAIAPSEKEIDRLVATAGEEGEPDEYIGKRGRLRFAVGMRLDVSTDPAVSTCAWPVNMRNISESGFAFYSKRQLRISASIYVREFSADNSAPWLAAYVTHCTTAVGGYMVGAAFGQPSDVPAEEPA